MVLIVKDLTFYHPFGNNEIRKLIDLRTFCLISSWDKLSWAMAVANHGPFLILNLTVLLSSTIFDSRVSFSAMKLGYWPTELTYLPTSLMNLSLSDSETKRTSYLLAHFLTNLASLAKTFISSKLWASTPIALAWSTCPMVPITHTLRILLTGWLRTTVELNFFSLSGLKSLSIIYSSTVSGNCLCFLSYIASVRELFIWALDILLMLYNFFSFDNFIFKIL